MIPSPSSQKLELPTTINQTIEIVVSRDLGEGDVRQSVIPILEKPASTISEESSNNLSLSELNKTIQGKI